MKKYKKMTQFLVSKKLRHVVFFYLLRNHGEISLYWVSSPVVYARMGKAAVVMTAVLFCLLKAQLLTIC